MELKTQERRESVVSSITLCRKASLLHRMRAYIEGQFRTSRGMVFDVCLGSLSIRLPSSTWKDSSFDRRVEFRTHDSDPYMRTAFNQAARRQQPMKSPQLPMREESAASFIDFLHYLRLAGER